MHPDEATEEIIKQALKYNKPFAVVPCCVFPKLFPNRQLKNGTYVRTYDQFIEYLMSLHSDIKKCIIPELISSNIILYKQ